MFRAKIYCFGLLQEIVQLELFAKQLYETTNPAARAEVEKTLVQFAAAPDCLNKCQLLLERAAVCFLAESILM